MMNREEAEKLCEIQGFIRKKTASAERFYKLQGKIGLIKKCSVGIKNSELQTVKKNETETLIYKDASDEDLPSENDASSDDDFEIYESGKKKQQRTKQDQDDSYGSYGSQSGSGLDDSISSDKDRFDKLVNDDDDVPMVSDNDSINQKAKGLGDSDDD